MVAYQDSTRGIERSNEWHTGDAPNARPSATQDGDGWQQHGSRGGNPDRLARGLGWFSLGLGLSAVAAPRCLARLIGVSDDGDTCAVLRAVGLREIATGIGIVAQRRPTGWLWARVGGDVMDLALLGSALKSDEVRRPRVVAAAVAVIGVMALDLRGGEQLNHSSDATQRRLPRDCTIRVQKSITVNRSPEELYQFWHHFENLPRFMHHLQSVQVTEEKRSHWKSKAPAGMTVEWDAEIIADRPNELIAWRSLEGADVDNAGSVHFKPAPGGRGTEVRVEMQYIPPAGVIGATIAKLFGEAPDQQVWDGLRRFKQLVEVGEVIQSEATARGRGPAQPAAMQVRL
jgi:uncharacterized membrane protein